MVWLERKVFSQAGQDGIIEYLFEVIGTTNKFFVEFGAGDGLHLSNTANLRMNKGWTGLLMDEEVGFEIAEEMAIENGRRMPYVFKEHVTAENIQNLFHKYKVPFTFDFLSIDIDGNDYWVWKAIKKWWPRVVSIEFNSNFGPKESVSVPYDPDHKWDGTSYYGASLRALEKLGGIKGYALVHRVLNLDAFFVRKDCLHGLLRRSAEELLPSPMPCFEPTRDREWVKVL